jgi:hypothetical protein
MREKDEKQTSNRHFETPRAVERRRDLPDCTQAGVLFPTNRHFEPFRTNREKDDKQTSNRHFEPLRYADRRRNLPDFTGGSPLAHKPSLRDVPH